MTNNRLPHILILGGAGFIGSKIARRFCESSYKVTVIDGLMKHTGGSRQNLAPVLGQIEFIVQEIQQVENLQNIVDDSNIIIDSMALTGHLLALDDPFYDLHLNAEAHLYLVNHLHRSDQKVIYLGSRSQYGNPNVERVTEDTPMKPRDIQGLHKTTAETYFSIYAGLRKLNVASLRLPACFGENQPVHSGDIGLVGGFIRKAIFGETIEVFGTSRARPLACVSDVAEIVFNLSQRDFKGFQPFNVGGEMVLINDLAELIVELVGTGSIKAAEIPDRIAQIDVGSVEFIDQRLSDYLGGLPKTELRKALAETISYFRKQYTLDKAVQQQP